MVARLLFYFGDIVPVYRMDNNQCVRRVIPANELAASEISSLFLAKIKAASERVKLMPWWQRNALRDASKPQFDTPREPIIHDECY